MNLEQQLKILINEAPQYGIAPIVIEKAINPVLKTLANQLKYTDYYILASQEGEWLLTTLSHRDNPQQEKTVIYAYSNAKDARKSQVILASKVVPTWLPVTHLIFQLFALQPVDSIIFMETPGNLDKGTEISRNKLQIMIEKELKKLNYSGFA
jgi:hypothetical protein